MQRIIIIGGGIMQLPVIKQAKSMHLQVTVVDGNPECVGFNYINQFHENTKEYPSTIVADISDGEKVLNTVKKVFLKESPHGVLTVGTDYSRTVSKVGGYYRLNVLPLGLTKYLTNKYHMRQKLTAAGLPQPKYRLIKSIEEFCISFEYFSNFTREVVIKPVDSMGARGVKLLNLGFDKTPNEEHIKDYENALQFSKTKQVIMEEKISGREYSLDALVFGDEREINIQITGVADRIIGYPPYFIETGHIIPSQQPKDVIKSLKEGFKKAIRAISAEEPTRSIRGAFKGDLFFTTEGNVVVSEIAGRLSGGYMSGYTYPLSSGVNLMEAAINTALGKNPFPLKEQALGVVVEKALVNKPGNVIRVEGIEETKASKGVKELFVQVKPGDVIRKPENNLMKSANVITRGPSYREADDFATQALLKLKVIIN